MSKESKSKCNKPIPCNQHEDIILSKIHDIERSIDSLIQKKMGPSNPSQKCKILPQTATQTKKTCEVKHPWFPSRKCKYPKGRRRRCAHQMPNLFSYTGSFAWSKP